MKNIFALAIVFSLLTLCYGCHRNSYIRDDCDRHHYRHHHPEHHSAVVVVR